MEHSGYLFAAFAIVWAVLFAYVVLLVRRQERLKQEIETLKEMLKEKLTGPQQ
jgi:CcmD family protein